MRFAAGSYRPRRVTFGRSSVLKATFCEEAPGRGQSSVTVVASPSGKGEGASGASRVTANSIVAAPPPVGGHQAEGRVEDGDDTESIACIGGNLSFPTSVSETQTIRSASCFREEPGNDAKRYEARIGRRGA